MKFRLTKAENGIVLELFLKAVQAGEEYQKIRYMIKDGEIYVNGEKEYARRMLLQLGDEVTFKDKYYVITTYKDENDPVGNDEDYALQKKNENPENRYIKHHQTPLQWSEKYEKEKPEKP